MANLMIHFRHQVHVMISLPTSVLTNLWMLYFMNSHSEMLPVFRALKLRRMQAQYNVCLKKVIKYIFGGSFFFEWIKLLCSPVVVWKLVVFVNFLKQFSKYSTKMCFPHSFSFLVTQETSHFEGAEHEERDGWSWGQQRRSWRWGTGGRVASLWMGKKIDFLVLVLVPRSEFFKIKFQSNKIVKWEKNWTLSYPSRKFLFMIFSENWAMLPIM